MNEIEAQCLQVEMTSIKVEMASVNENRAKVHQVCEELRVAQESLFQSLSMDDTELRCLREEVTATNTAVVVAHEARAKSEAEANTVGECDRALCQFPRNWGLLVDLSAIKYALWTCGPDLWMLDDKGENLLAVNISNARIRAILFRQK
ncbi:hypothetical protein ACLOJK_026198 [Asimina triloba]